MAVARLVEERLASMKEATSADHEERLYWEAVLQGRVLNNKIKAIKLLEQAERLQPKDQRVVDLGLDLTAAVNQFGH